MLAQEILSPADVSAAQYELLIPGQVASYEAGWLRCQLQANSLQISTTEPADFERLRDVAVALLRASADTPISQMGLNRAIHFEVDSFEKWHTVGDNLVNNDVWKDVLQLPGMRTLTIWAGRSDKYWGRIQVQIEPSNVYRSAVYVAFNDHFDLTRADTQPASREESLAGQRRDDTEATFEKIPIAVEILTNEWGSSFRRSTAVIDRVMQQAGKSR